MHQSLIIEFSSSKGFNSVTRWLEQFFNLWPFHNNENLRTSTKMPKMWIQNVAQIFLINIQNNFQNFHSASKFRKFWSRWSLQWVRSKCQFVESWALPVLCLKVTYVSDFNDVSTKKHKSPLHKRDKNWIYSNLTLNVKQIILQFSNPFCVTILCA